MTFVIIPTYNERQNLPTLLPAILAVDPELDVLIVDDNSPDGTTIADAMAKADNRISVLHRKDKPGLGPARVAGFRHALEQGYGRVVQMDPDHSHRPDDLRGMLQVAEEGDVVIGSRNVPGGRVEGRSIVRNDCTSGFKCLQRGALLAIDVDRLRSNRYAFQIEVNNACHRAGLRIVEVPIVFPDRTQ